TTTAADLTAPMKGAMNMNTAPLEGLLTLPQMPHPVAQATVDSRTPQPLVSRGDLLQIAEVTPAIFNAIVEKVTVISDTFTVRALGSFRLPNEDPPRVANLAVHVTARLDCTSGRCRIAWMRQDN